MGGNEFPERLKKLRKQEGLKKYKLSELCGLPSTSIGKYERGDAVPTIKALISIADHFNVSTDYLLGRTNY